MRILIDALGAPPSSGGMRMYTDELLRAWIETYPDDELHVVGYDYLAPLADRATVHLRPEGTRSRILGQWWDAGRLARRHRVDALISLSSVVSPLMPRGRRVCTVHDWRHRRRPEEYSRAVLAYRRSWEWSVAHSGAVAVISEKTDAETRRFVPGARTALVPNGRDAARHWGTPAPAEIARPYVLTFGHFVNKRPGLVIDALAGAEDLAGHDLVVLGARGEVADGLRESPGGRALGERLHLPGFVEDDRYRSLVAHAACVVMASTDEGFGLPVAEANFFGIPCVVTDDGGLVEIHGDRVIGVEPTATGLAAGIGRALAADLARLTPGPDETWAATARRMRELCRPR